VIDLAGAQLGYATGRPEASTPAATLAWRPGLDVVALSQLCDVVVTGCFAGPQRLEVLDGIGRALSPGMGAGSVERKAQA
jgi:hypothetical protein